MAVHESVKDLIDQEVDGIELPASIQTITTPSLIAAMPSEAVCPVIPGVTFPAFPDISDVGALASDAIEDVGSLVKRVTNPSSAIDALKEFGNEVSTTAQKAASALKTAAVDVKDDVAEGFSQAFDDLQGEGTALSGVLGAIESGAIDISQLGINVLDLPASVLVGAYSGLLNAVECLKGPSGTGEAAFNETSPALDEGLADGRGDVAAQRTAIPIPESPTQIEETGASDYITNEEFFAAELAAAELAATEAEGAGIILDDDSPGAARRERTLNRLAAGGFLSRGTP